MLDPPLRHARFMFPYTRALSHVWLKAVIVQLVQKLKGYIASTAVIATQPVANNLCARLLLVYIVDSCCHGTLSRSAAKVVVCGNSCLTYHHALLEMFFLKYALVSVLIDRIHKWRSRNYSFVFVLIILTSLTLEQKLF